MAAKLDIKSIEFRNFLSYGDYVTKLEISDLGPTLVTGKNGAGKTTFMSALIWCIFGRLVGHTSGKISPGDKIVNWHTGSNCVVKVTTSDGWAITRTRLTDNHNELLVHKNDDDTTKSTNKKAQAFLLEHFGLDYEIFTSSIFCGQFGKSFLEMAPVKRKEAIERLLGLDKINDYAQKAKQKCSNVESEQSGVRTALEILEKGLEKQRSHIEDSKNEIVIWDQERSDRIDKLNQEIETIIPQLEAADPPDIKKLKSKWDLYHSLENKISEYKKRIDFGKSKIRSCLKSVEDLQHQVDNPQVFDVPSLDDLEREHQRADAQEAAESEREHQHAKLCANREAIIKEISHLAAKIAEWNSKSESTCTLCEQEIGVEHVHTQVEALKERQTSCKDDLGKLDEKIEECSTPIKIVRPSMSLKQAERLHEANERSGQEVERAQDKIASYQEEIQKLEKTNEKLQKDVIKAEGALESAKPSQSLEDAQDDHNRYEKMCSQLSVAQRLLNRAKNEVNPHAKILQDLEKRLEESKSEISEYETQIRKLDLLYSHYKYIWRSYSDRRKIKSLVLSELIPYLNDRIAHYLSVFNIDMTIKFSATLSNETDKWGYEFCSGGERKKIDLSIMFAIYDLYISLYGQQCNIMVFDEVDSRLDADGVQVFSDIITSYFSDDNPMKPDTIFVISHKPELKDLLPSQMVIKKENGFSIIEQN